MKQHVCLPYISRNLVYDIFQNLFASKWDQAQSFFYFYECMNVEFAANFCINSGC